MSRLCSGVLKTIESRAGALTLLTTSEACRITADNGQRAFTIAYYEHVVMSKLCSGIPQVILLTKVDKLSKDVEEDLSLVFKSSDVKEHVEKASQLLGLPRANVLPVKNYENEEELDENISILALMAMRKILNFAEDFLDHMLDKKED